MKHYQEESLIEFAKEYGFENPDFLTPSQKEIDEFYRILLKFNETQDYVVGKLVSLWDMKLPMNTGFWVSWSNDLNESHNFKNDEGIDIFPHGFGLSFKDDLVWIDFDFGDQGETDGFDPNRLWLFIKNNRIKTTLISIDQIDKIIKDQVEKDIIIFSGYINYYKKRVTTN